MAIRLRIVNGKHIVVCAACTVEKPGDIYLGDEWHGPLSDKFARDFNETFAENLPYDKDAAALVETEESNNPARDWWDKTYGDEGRKKPAGHAPTAPPDVQARAAEIVTSWFKDAYGEVRHFDESRLADLIKRFAAALSTQGAAPAPVGNEYTGPTCPKCQQGYVCQHCGELLRATGGSDEPCAECDLPLNRSPSRYCYICYQVLREKLAVPPATGLEYRRTRK